MTNCGQLFQICWKTTFKGLQLFGNTRLVLSIGINSSVRDDFKRLLKKIQISQNNCIRYCLKLDNRAHIGANEFKEINWLPTKERVSQCICVNVFKFFNNMAPDYTSEIFHPSHSRHNTRMSTYKLDLPFRKSVYGQKTLSYLGPKTWNSLPAQIKLCKNVNSFKHDIKNLYFKRLQKSDDSIFMYY